MTNETIQTESTQPEKFEVILFGERLLQARLARKLTVTDIADSIKLSEGIIDAIDKSDTNRLPVPTFVQGYLRAYARQVGVDEEIVIQEYNQVVNAAVKVELRPRSSLPSEANSRSPYIKVVSGVIFSAVVLAVLYGVYGYYSKKVDSNDIVALDDEDYASASVALRVDDYADVVADDKSATAKVSADMKSNMDTILKNSNSVDTVKKESAENVRAIDIDRPTDETTGRAVMIQVQSQAPGDDIIELISSEESWLEVVDANSVNLYYNLIKKDRALQLKGTAPFDVFLGNAPVVQVKVNSVEIDKDRFVRANNIARFKVSSRDQKVIFH